MYVPGDDELHALTLAGEEEWDFLNADSDKLTFVVVTTSGKEGQIG